MYRELESKIAYKGISKKQMAEDIDMNYNTLLAKMSGKSKFTLDEAVIIKTYLQEELPIEARIITVADVFDALCVFRVYKKAWKTDDAYAYILGESGKSFDPRCVAAFKKIYPSVRKLYAHISVNQPENQTADVTEQKPS